MDGLHMFLVVLLGAVSYSHGWISAPVLETTVRPGDNITLYCDCQKSAAVLIVWYRNCSHENQPSLVLKTNHFSPGSVVDSKQSLKTPRYQFVRNISSESYDLLIMNITDSDEGLYYCGTEETQVVDKEYVTRKTVYRYGNVTRIRIITTVYRYGNVMRIRINHNSNQRISGPPCFVSWMTAFTSAVAVLSAFHCFLMIYRFRQRTDKESQILQKRPDTRAQTRWNQEEDACLTRVVFWVKEGKAHH